MKSLIPLCLLSLLFMGCVGDEGRGSASLPVATLDPPPRYTPCPGCQYNEEDADCDGVPLLEDNCSDQCNPGQENADGDLYGDACDRCDFDPGDDIDRDGVCAGGVGGSSEG